MEHLTEDQIAYFREAFIIFDKGYNAYLNIYSNLNEFFYFVYYAMFRW